MAPPRRVGRETSQTRDRLLDCVERLMVDTGYPGVTYRAVAAMADVTPGLVQYYFPTLNDIFAAAIRRSAARNLKRLVEKLATRPDEPLRVLWEFSREEATANLMTEYTALGNHRSSIRVVIADVMEEVRKVQLDTLDAKWGQKGVPGGDLTPGALLFLLTGIPKMIALETGVGVSTTHAEVMETFERYLNAVEQPPDDRRRSPTTTRKLLQP
jgi:AcrR family transcriptional regulator